MCYLAFVYHWFVLLCHLAHTHSHCIYMIALVFFIDCVLTCFITLMNFHNCISFVCHMLGEFFHDDYTFSYMLLFTTTLALHVSLKCGVIRFRLCDRKRPRLHDGVHVLARWLTTWEGLILLLDISVRFGLVIWREVSSFKRLDFNDFNVFQNWPLHGCVTITFYTKIQIEFCKILETLDTHTFPTVYYS